MQSNPITIVTPRSFTEDFDNLILNCVYHTELFRIAKTTFKRKKLENLCCTVLSRSVVSNSLKPHGLQPTRLLCPWGFSRQEYQSVLPCPPPADLPNPGIEHRSPALQADSLSSEPPGKPKNTGMCSLSLRQWNFPTQELSWGLELMLLNFIYQYNNLIFTKLWANPYCDLFLYCLRAENSFTFERVIKINKEYIMWPLKHKICIIWSFIKQKLPTLDIKQQYSGWHGTGKGQANTSRNRVEV